MNPISKFLARGLMLLAALGSGVASATTVNFEDVSSGIFGLPFNSTGFTFSGSGSVGVTNDGSDCSPPCSSNGTQRLLVPGTNFGTTSVTMSRIDSALFALTGFDGAEMFSGVPGSDAAQIDYIGYIGSTVVVMGSAVLDGINDGPAGAADFQSFTFTGVLVDRIVFSGSGGTDGNNAFALDNIVTSAGTVPAPGTLAVVGLGLIGVAASRRKVR